jgi:HK97 gp10 family phage protein
MADFNVTGLDDVIKDMMQHQKAAEEAVPEMLKAGAEILVKAQRDEIRSMKLVDTGDMMKSIKSDKIKKDPDGNSYIDVYPQGKDRKGVRNADKAFIAEFGKHGEPARPWMRTANAKSAEEVTDAEKEIWDKYKGG